MWTWYCPKDGLEHRCLVLTGWRVSHSLAVDGVPWVRLCKPKDCLDLSIKLN